MQPGLLHYLLSDCVVDALPDEPAQRRAVLHASDALRWHPTLDGWLQVHKKTRNGPERWLLCPPVVTKIYSKYFQNLDSENIKISQFILTVQVESDSVSA